MRVAGAAALGLALSLAGCGYRVAGKADLLPKSIKTIAVPPFLNATVRYKLNDRLPAAITRELISRTRYDVVADAGAADAVLSGGVVNYAAFPTVFNPATGRATSVQVNVQLQISLRGRDGKVLFSRPFMEFHERYEISIDPGSYFDESDVALDRLSRDVARNIVSAVLENF